MGKIADRFAAKRLKVKPSEGMTLQQALDAVDDPNFEAVRNAKIQYDLRHRFAPRDEDLDYINSKKGRYGGLCNRSGCLSPNNVFNYNREMHAFYCRTCTNDINRWAVHDKMEPFIEFKTEEQAKELYVNPNPL